MSNQYEDWAEYGDYPGDMDEVRNDRTPEETLKWLNEVEARNKAAIQEWVEAVRRHFENRKFHPTIRASIPTQKSDTDILIGDALSDAKELIRLARQAVELREQYGELQEWFRKTAKERDVAEARIATLEAERNQAISEISEVGRRLGEEQERNRQLEAEVERLRKPRLSGFSGRVRVIRKSER